MYGFLAVLLFLYSKVSESRFLTNSGCICALSKSTILTPNASAISVAGCSTKMDWTGVNSTWCLTDQSVPCGTYKSLYGYTDSCSAVSLSSTFSPAVLLQYDQTSNIFYTGQILTVTWNSTNILNNEFLKVTYQGTAGLRTLTTGSGVNITTGFFLSRISDSANSLATNTSLLLSTTSPTLSLALNPPITILQSKLINITVYDGSRLITTGSSIVCDNRIITVNWVGIGEAQIGNATVTIKSSFGGGGGGGTTVGTPVLTVAPAITSVNYTCPRSFTPGFGGTTYTAQLSVQSPGVGVAPYTLSSNSFGITAAPTQTPTSSLTPTQTPTPSLSFGASASITPSITPTSSSTIPATPSTTPTSSATPTSSITSTSTVSQSPQASIDVGAIANAATANSMALLSAVLGGLGGFLALSILIYVGYKMYQRYEFRKRRLARRKGIYDQTVIKNERETLYGIQTVITENPQPMVMYQSTASKNAGLGRQVSGRQGYNRRSR